jgi:hypothetical protein
MLARGGRMLVSSLAMLVGRGGVRLGLFVLTDIVMMRCLMMMMRGRVVMSSGVMMVLA